MKYQALEDARKIAARNLGLECSCGHGWGSHGLYGCAVKVGSASCDDAYCSCGVRPPALEAKLREERRLKVVRDPCLSHPRYQCKRAPRSACETCWRMWVEVNPWEPR